MLSRSILDAALIATKAFPLAGAFNTSPAIDLETAAPGISLETVEFGVVAPALPLVADAATISYVVEDSADGVAFAPVVGLAPIISTGAGGLGAPALERKVKLPPSIRRYVRASTTVLAGGGDNTALKYSASLFF
jgi:hypothetical protein